MSAGSEPAGPATWTAVALSADVPPGTPVPVILDGRELVVWRGASGEARVWEDRCPHRGMRLSFGFVRGDALACLYHGWRFGLDAGCTTIPAHPDLTPPKTLCAKAFAVAEAGGLVFTSGSAETPAGGPPEMGDATPVRSLDVAAPADRVRAALAAAGARFDGPVARIEAPGGLALVVALHGAEAGRTMVHVLADGPADRAALLAAADWAMGLRHSVEAAEASTTPNLAMTARDAETQ
ncbi:Rieske 2Fe-2S domain-containing protein [Chthonobacter rhizosphaerae]|uniref:Rieske 2Fe-2S domain-containing protein n=1 Tax=Chthonobacter rhizosphaerae TaxID=2735553 RepID=UPI0015EF0699